MSATATPAKPKLLIKRGAKLPGKLSDCILVAIADLAKVEKMKDTYVVDMGQWHSSRLDSTGRCAVCLAGAAMAISLQVKPEVYTNGIPADVGCFNSNRIAALEEIRCGCVDYALGYLGEKTLDKIPEFDFPDYEDDRAKFKAGVRRIANWLKKRGL